ncbi:DUF1329 domain-containing protein [Azohydromonas australica]|uniref:DUF1329 domain-containing protein n=1 Tax=Azohydromonas australica TaxID=364039 RepID=UPI0004066393|nr:DUF1329 domain-containing protein [Azohydromonas australica]
MKISRHLVLSAMAVACAQVAVAGVSADEAAKLKSELTPLGAEKAGNKDGTIPAWTGGLSDPKAPRGGRRPDPFASEKPLFSITAQNLAQYADKLAESQVAMFKKHPTYRIDVYKTHRTMAAPQWVYDNTLKNATKASLTKDGAKVESAYGGIPFPIPKSAEEVMWNHRLAWRTPGWHQDFNVWLGTGGKLILASSGQADYSMPYYYKDKASDFKGVMWQIRQHTVAPAIRAGEAIIGREPIDDTAGNQTWTYVAGQRRVRKLPVSTYDVPTPASAGLLNFDEINVFAGAMDRYDWKLVGKKEVFIPYNSNKFLQPQKDSDVLGPNFLNPDHVRWELHRVWVVEANLKPGMRHTKPKRRFYCDEDSWVCALGDSWDAKGQLVNAAWHLSYVAPEAPGLLKGAFGVYDLITGDYVANSVLNTFQDQMPVTEPKSDSYFTPEAMAADGVR